MIWAANSLKDIGDTLTEAGFDLSALHHEPILLKINLARPPEPAHPRTDPAILRSILQYCLDAHAFPTVCESANGCLAQNLAHIGILDFLHANKIPYFDIDDQETITVQHAHQQHYLPKRFTDFAYRLALPCASKRERMRFSNNVKLFIGAIPRHPYIRPNEGMWRSKIHDDLDVSICCVYRAIEAYSPFQYYINGGNAYAEHCGAFNVHEVLVGTDALELDTQVLSRYFQPSMKPPYLTLLEDGKY